VRLGVANLLVIQLVQGLEAVERLAADLRGNAWWVVDIEDRVTGRAE
jgi:hypothetical protein